MVHLSGVKDKSWMEARIWSPGEIVILVMSIETLGISSYQTENCGCPFTVSCSVPHWIRVWSNCPPMPIQASEEVSVNVGVTDGIVQIAVTPVMTGCGD